MVAPANPSAANTFEAASKMRSRTSTRVGRVRGGLTGDMLQQHTREYRVDTDKYRRGGWRCRTLSWSSVAARSLTERVPHLLPLTLESGTGRWPRSRPDCLTERALSTPPVVG